MILNLLIIYALLQLFLLPCFCVILIEILSFDVLLCYIFCFWFFLFYILYLFILLVLYNWFLFLFEKNFLILCFLSSLFLIFVKSVVSLLKIVGIMYSDVFCPHIFSVRGTLHFELLFCLVDCLWFIFTRYLLDS